MKQIHTIEKCYSNYQIIFFKHHKYACIMKQIHTSNDIKYLYQFNITCINNMIQHILSRLEYLEFKQINSIVINY